MRKPVAFAAMQPRHWRAVLYALTLLAQPVVVYLHDKHLIGAPEVTLSTGITAAVLGLAGYKALRPDGPA